MHCCISDLCHLWFNTLMPRQYGRHFPDDIFKYIFLNENAWISIKSSLNFVHKDPIQNIPALVQILAGCWPVDKPLSEPMMDRLLMHICITRPQWVNLLRPGNAFAYQVNIGSCDCLLPFWCLTINWIDQYWLIVNWTHRNKIQQVCINI